MPALPHAGLPSPDVDPMRMPVTQSVPLPMQTMQQSLPNVPGVRYQSQIEPPSMATMPGMFSPNLAQKLVPMSQPVAYGVPPTMPGMVPMYGGPHMSMYPNLYDQSMMPMGVPSGYAPMNQSQSGMPGGMSPMVQPMSMPPPMINPNAMSNNNPNIVGPAGYRVSPSLQPMRDPSNISAPSMAPMMSIPFESNSPVDPGDITYINGAIELSAVARPFIPKTFTPTTATAAQSNQAFPAMSIPAGHLDNANMMTSSNVVSNNPFSSVGGLDGLGLSSGNNAVWSSSSVGGLPGSSIGGLNDLGRSDIGLPKYLSGILGSDINIGLGNQEQYEFDTGNDMMPDLDSLLPNDLGDLK